MEKKIIINDYQNLKKRPISESFSESIPPTEMVNLLKQYLPIHIGVGTIWNKNKITKFEQTKRLKNDCDEDTKLGIKIVREAIQEPIKQIMYNAGEKADVIIEKILNEPMANYGYDAKGKQFGDLIELGIIDPAKVARVALENASSIVGTLLTTSCAIYTVNDKSSLSSAESLMY